jgi:hypothetical protein
MQHRCRRLQDDPLSLTSATPIPGRAPVCASLPISGAGLAIAGCPSLRGKASHPASTASVDSLREETGRAQTRKWPQGGRNPGPMPSLDVVHDLPVVGAPNPNSRMT